MSYKGFDLEKGLKMSEFHVNLKKNFFSNKKKRSKLIFLVFKMDSEMKLIKVSHIFCETLISNLKLV